MEMPDRTLLADPSASGSLRSSVQPNDLVATAHEQLSRAGVAVQLIKGALEGAGAGVAPEAMEAGETVGAVTSDLQLGAFADSREVVRIAREAEVGGGAGFAKDHIDQPPIRPVGPIT